MSHKSCLFYTARLTFVCVRTTPLEALKKGIKTLDVSKHSRESMMRADNGSSRLVIAHVARNTCSSILYELIS